MIIASFVIFCFLLAIAIVSNYFLLPLPLLSYQQGKADTDYGEVTEVKNIRPGVFEIGLKQVMEVKGDVETIDIQMIGGSITRFFHLRNEKTLPKIGQKISIVSVNRFHRFTVRSFNWIKDWKPYEGEIPTGGTVELLVQKF